MMVDAFLNELDSTILILPSVQIRFNSVVVSTCACRTCDLGSIPYADHLEQLQKERNWRDWRWEERFFLLLPIKVVGIRVLPRRRKKNKDIFVSGL